jgi:hypothetical protein
VGENSGTITNCYATGEVTGNDRTGGLVGQNDGTITNCYATGSVSGGSCTGGLVGYNSTGCAIENCYATGSVSGNNNDTGGLVGCNVGSITNSYATGSVERQRRPHRRLSGMKIPHDAPSKIAMPLVK